MPTKLGLSICFIAYLIFCSSVSANYQMFNYYSDLGEVRGAAGYQDSIFLVQGRYVKSAKISAKESLSTLYTYPNSGLLNLAVVNPHDKTLYISTSLSELVSFDLTTKTAKIIPLKHTLLK